MHHQAQLCLLSSWDSGLQESGQSRAGRTPLTTVVQSCTPTTDYWRLKKWSLIYSYSSLRGLCCQCPLREEKMRPGEITQAPPSSLAKLELELCLLSPLPEETGKLEPQSLKKALGKANCLLTAACRVPLVYQVLSPSNRPPLHRSGH